MSQRMDRSIWVRVLVVLGVRDRVVRVDLERAKGGFWGVGGLTISMAQVWPGWGVWVFWSFEFWIWDIGGDDVWWGRVPWRMWWSTG